MDALDTLMDAALANIKTAVQEKPKIEITEGMIMAQAQAMITRGYLPYDRPAFRSLARWLAAIKAEATNKGLILSGAAGTGKTMFFKTVCDKRVLKTATILKLWKQNNGTVPMNELYDLSELEPMKFHVVIDELGEEPVGITFGFREEVMSGVISHRYDVWKECGHRTYFTTNLAWAQLEERYGRRITDRLREMCALVEFTGPSKRGSAT